MYNYLDYLDIEDFYYLLEHGNYNLIQDIFKKYHAKNYDKDEFLRIFSKYLQNIYESKNRDIFFLFVDYITKSFSYLEDSILLILKNLDTFQVEDQYRLLSEYLQGAVRPYESLVSIFNPHIQKLLTKFRVVSLKLDNIYAFHIVYDVIWKYGLYKNTDYDTHISYLFKVLEKYDSQEIDTQKLFKSFILFIPMIRGKAFFDEHYS